MCGCATGKTLRNQNNNNKHNQGNMNAREIVEQHKFQQIIDKHYKFKMMRNERYLASQPIPKQVKLYQLAQNCSYNEDYLDLLNQLKTTGGFFQDQEYLPNITSLGKPGCKEIPNPEQIVWLRPNQFQGWNKIYLFPEKMKPNDIKQGTLGDCYFLGSLSCLADREDQIRRIFNTDTYCEQGLYTVCLYKQGQLTQLVLDDHFPCNSQTKLPIFSTGYGNELWILLLEKAYSKLYGSYQNICVGKSFEAINDLTGAPYDDLEVNENIVEEIWEFMHNNFSKGNILAACSLNKENNTNTIDMKGIVYDHIYSILDVRDVQSNGQQIRLINLRNPWGKKEWSGDWNDNSDKWTKEIKAQVNYVNQENGSFWMDINNFCKLYSNVGANYLHSDYYQNSIEVSFANKQPHLKYPVQFIWLTIQNDNSHVYIQFHQPNERYFYDKKDQYRQSYISLSLFSAEYNPTTQRLKVNQYHGHKDTNKRDGYIECRLNKGRYLIAIGSHWKQELTRDLVVSTYSSCKTELELMELSTDQIFDFIKDAIVLFPFKDKEDSIITHEGFKQFKWYNTYKFGLQIYLYDNQNENQGYKQILTFDQNAIKEVCAPYNAQQSSFEIDVPSKTKKLFFYTHSSSENRSKFNYKYFFFEKDEQLIQSAREKPSKKDFRQLGGKQSNISFINYWFSLGLVLVYENKENYEYKEELTLNLKNLKLMNLNLDTRQPIIVTLAPNSIKSFIFHKIDYSQDGEFNYVWKSFK